VTDFQQAPAVEEALHILVQSYDKLELPELRDSASRVLRQNFPQSAFLGGPGAQAAKPWWRFW
jgi:outer membrane protein assembly factor BamD